MMKRGRGIVTRGVTAFIVGMLFAGSLWAVDATIIGEVNDQDQIVGTDGEIFSVAENDIGMELVTEHVGDMVEVIGIIEYFEEDDRMNITVKRFEVVDPGDMEE